MKKREKAEKKTGQREELLIDYFEKTAAFLRERKKKLQELERHYKESYSRDIKDEMNLVKGDIKRKLAEFVDRLYENAEELRHIKKYFPDFFAILLEEPEIGKILKKHDVLFDTLKFPQAERHLATIRQARARLKDAIRFIEKWPGIIKRKQLVATYPVLEGEIKEDMESADAIEKIRDMDNVLKREGWKVIISNSDLLAQIIERYMEKSRKLDAEILRLALNYNDAKGKGTVSEYNALRMLDNARKKKEKTERFIKRLMLANAEFLGALKKNKNWLGRRRKTELEKIAENVAPKKVREKIWLDRMRKRLAT